MVPWIAEAYLRAGLVRSFLTWWKAKHHDLFGTAARVPRAAHAVIFDAAERFNAAILDFLRETEDPLASHRDTEAQR